MTDREIVDRLVALGIVRRDGDQFFLGEVKLHGGWLHDWRVAGACLERMTEGHIAEQLKRDDYSWDFIRSPRAIIEAYIEAVSDE